MIYGVRFCHTGINRLGLGLHRPRFQLSVITDVNEEQHHDVLWYCVVVTVSTGPHQQHPINPHQQQEGKGWGHFAKEETWFGGSGGTPNEVHHP